LLLASLHNLTPLSIIERGVCNAREDLYDDKDRLAIENNGIVHDKFDFPVPGLSDGFTPFIDERLNEIDNGCIDGPYTQGSEINRIA